MLFLNVMDQLVEGPVVEATLLAMVAHPTINNFGECAAVIVHHFVKCQLKQINVCAGAVTIYSTWYKETILTK